MFIRAVHNGQKKKIKGSDKPSFEFLMKELVRCFGEGVKKAEIGYYDEDKEFIRLTNEEEWEICIEETQIKSKGKDVFTVEVHVLSGENAPEISQTSEISNSFIVAPNPDTTNSEIQDWKVIGKSDEDQKMLSEPILNKSMSMPTEPSIFEEPVAEEQPVDASQFQSFTNTSQNDILVDIKVTGTPEELERIQRTVIHQFAPHAGFEIDRCEVLVKRECPEEKEETDSVFDNTSQLSSMTTELRDEIETLIEEKLKRMSLFNQEPNMMKKSTPVRISSGNFDHGCVTCDICRQRITGCARYKSIFRKDFDLCETCEATGVHPEPLIKIRNPIGMRIGMRLNAEFDNIKRLFIDEEPKKIQVVHKSQQLCHIRRTNEEKLEKINKAEQTLKSSVSSIKTEKMDVEKTSKAPSLCHIRTTPKIEEKKEVKIEVATAPVTVTPMVVEEPKVRENPMLNIVSRIFPHHDTRIIAEILEKNQGLALEEIVNKIMDYKF